MNTWLTDAVENVLDFSGILNTSIAASWMVLAVICLRFLLKRAPKWTHVALWGLVAVRLLLPFSIESEFSLIPSTETVPQEILRYEGTQLSEPAYIDVISNPIFSGDITIELEQTVDRVQIRMMYMTFLWLAGIGVMLTYLAISYLRIFCRIRLAKQFRDNIYISETISSPFVFGIIHPRICLPENMDAVSMSYVIAHEEAHIRRKDHWWKPFGFLLLTLHWFNPVMWLAYILLCRDIEMACDERVVRDMGEIERADYSEALLECSVKRSMISACPLACGEIGVKQRIKSVLHYKKPTFWIVSVAVVACVAAAVCFLTNPPSKQPDFTVTMEELYGLTQPATIEVFIDGYTYDDVYFLINDIRYEITAPPTVSNPEYRLAAIKNDHMKAVRLRMNPDEASMNVTLYMIPEEGVERVYVCDINAFEKLLTWQNSGMRVDMETVDYQIFVNPDTDVPSPQNIVLLPQQGTFQFSFSMNYADCLSGTYLAIGDTLILKDDEGALYTFDITEAGLVFDAEHSAKISESHYHSTKKNEYPVPDGMVFVSAEMQRLQKHDHLREKYPNAADGEFSRDFIMDLRGDAMKDGHSEEIRTVAEKIVAAVWNPGETCATLFVHNCTDADWGLFSIYMSHYYYRVIEVKWADVDT